MTPCRPARTLTPSARRWAGVIRLNVAQHLTTMWTGPIPMPPQHGSSPPQRQTLGTFGWHIYGIGPRLHDRMSEKAPRAEAGTSYAARCQCHSASCAM